MAKKKCPRCGSENLMEKEYAGGKFLFCGDCDYDESEEVDLVAEERTNQKAKGEYNIYRSRLGKK